MSFKTRLRKLELHKSKSRKRMFVVQGTLEQHDGIIDELKASGRATDKDMFVCLTDFGDPIHEKGILLHEHPL
jgi:hypothetical protein